MKAKKSSEARQLEEIPNVGPRIADDLRLLGVNSPNDLKGKDGIELYLKLNEMTGQRHDPCVADTFMAAVEFVEGGPSKTWWSFTAKRKKIFQQRGLA